MPTQLKVYVQGYGEIDADGANTFEQTCDNLTQLAGITGVPGMQIFARGFVVPNDGGAGAFYWLASGTANDGVNFIRPTGSAVGCWARVVGGSSVVGSAVATLTQLRSSNASIGSVVYVLNYATAGDNGGGFFQIFSSSQGTDDGGFNINLSSGLFAQRQLDGAMLTPEMFGAKGDGTTVDSTPLQAFLRALALYGAGELHSGKTYLIDTQMTISTGGFLLEGNGASIKVKSGTVADAAHVPLLFNGATNFSVRDLVCNGNLAGRTGTGALPGHNIWLQGCSFFNFENCHSLNSTTDGWYVVASNEADITKFCHDGVFLNCSANHSYRNGMSIIVGYKLDVIGGHYDNSLGTAPQAGIDIEADGGAASPSSYAVKLSGVVNTGNAGYQFSVSSVVSPDAIIIDRCVADGTGGGTACGAFTIAASDVLLANLEIRNFTTNTGATNILYFSGTTQRVSLFGATFKNITNASALMNVVYGLGCSGLISNLTFISCTSGCLVFMDTSLGVTVDGLIAVSCGRDDLVNGNGLTAFGNKSALLNAYFTGCHGIHIADASSGVNTFKNITAVSPTLGVPTSQGVMSISGNAILDNIQIYTPSLPGPNVGYGIRCFNEPKSLGYYNISGFAAGNSLNFPTAGAPQVTTTGSVTLGQVTRFAAYTGAGAHTITLPLATLFSEGELVQVRILHGGDATALTIAVQGGDTLVGLATLAQNTSAWWSLDVQNRTWYARPD